MNENSDTQNRVPVAGLAVDACSASLRERVLPNHERLFADWKAAIAENTHLKQRLGSMRETLADVHIHLEAEGLTMSAPIMEAVTRELTSPMTDAMIPGADPEEWAAKKEYILRGVQANARLLSSPNK